MADIAGAKDAGGDGQRADDPASPAKCLAHLYINFKLRIIEEDNMHSKSNNTTSSRFNQPYLGLGALSGGGPGPGNSAAA